LLTSLLVPRPHHSPYTTLFRSLAPTPTSTSTNSEPLIEKNGTPASPATARASKVLPVPGGPTSSTPRGILPPSFWNFPGVLKNSDRKSTRLNSSHGSISYAVFC